MKRHAENHRRLVARGHGREDAIRGEALDEDKLHTRVQAVQQATHQAKNMDHRCQANDAFALARIAVQLGVTIQFRDQVSGRARDDLGRSSGPGAELNERVLGRRVMATRARLRGSCDVGEAAHRADCGRDAVIDLNEHLRLEPVQRPLDLVLG